MKEIDIKKVLESSGLQDPDFKQKLLASLMEIANREQITENNCDLKDIPWEDYQFSKRIMPMATKSHQQTLIEADFIQKIANLKTVDTILDIASGDGRLSMEFAKRGFDVTGIDKSPYAIEYCTKNAHDQNLSNCQFIHGNVSDIALDKKFDAGIIIFGALANLTQNEAEKLVDNLSESIVPGGHLIMELCCLIDNITCDFQEWYFSDSGLWGDSTYLVLTENFFNVKDRFMAIRYYIIDIINGTLELVTGREQYYDFESIENLLNRGGLIIEDVWGDWSGSEYSGENEIMIVHARKLHKKTLLLRCENSCEPV